MAEEAQKKPLSIRELAVFLGIHEETVRRRIKDGSIPTIRIGNVIRIPRSFLRKFE
jgi:excisionase family DNA binding protein